MCLYPKLLENKKYMATKKNNYTPPTMGDYRTKYITAACGKCLECRKQRARGWMIRLHEEVKNNKNGVFVTLTFSEEALMELQEGIDSKYDDENEELNKIATLAVRRFLERVRKETKKSVRHWLITERGHEGTKRIHLHGIIWAPKDLIERRWQYGWVWYGKWVNEQTASYITKYMTKTDYDNPEFGGKVLCSPGIGRGYENTINGKNNKKKKEPMTTNTTYRYPNGQKASLPTYYKNKIYSEDEREELWIERLDQGIAWVMGEEVPIDDEESYNRLMEYHRKRAATIDKRQQEKWEEKKYRKRLAKQREYYRASRPI